MKEGIHQITINKQQLHVLVVMFLEVGSTKKI